jgi:hypothetical protein
MKGLDVSAMVRIGYPPGEIAEVTSEHRAGLIMGLRGRDGLFAQPPGSCAVQVLSHGVAPVLALADSRANGR